MFVIGLITRLFQVLMGPPALFAWIVALLVLPVSRKLERRREGVESVETDAGAPVGAAV